jgi:type II secretory pathway component PulF
LTFTETLATLVQHGVVLPEALRLASDACGDLRLRDSGHELATRLETGEVVDAREALAGTPRLLALVLTSKRTPDQLATTLRRMGEGYRQEAIWMSRWLAISVPFWFTVTIGGLATLAYAFSVIWPFANVLLELSKPVSG